MEVADPIIPHTARGNLTTSLSRWNSAIIEELEAAMARELPVCDKWTSVKVSETLQRIVAVMSGRIFVGPELCRSQAYIEAALNIAQEAGAAVQSISILPFWKRPFVSTLEVRKLHQRQEKIHSVLRPVLEKRIQMNEADRPDDMLTWIINSQKKLGERSFQTMAKLQGVLHLAAINTTSEMATNAFYNLAAMPEIVPILREEIHDVLKEHDGVVSTKSLQVMKKLDSFLKETSRLYPPFFCELLYYGILCSSFERKVLRTFTLSNGQVIPAGSMLKVPSQAIMSDPAVFPNPDQFDPLRFYKLRQQTSVHENGRVTSGARANQFVTSDKASLVFGFGRHACPGRFLAAEEIKMILVYMLRQYDIRLEEGETQRYDNLEFGASNLPDPTKTLRFKRIAI
ncbi:hypothetical protein S40288_10198 [Stachybotrys chartarum IBT 40288]|nr:hypothetical protein S40288_10198 [Stachybotrys chartarum IBT 40288]